MGSYTVEFFVNKTNYEYEELGERIEFKKIELNFIPQKDTYINIKAFEKELGIEDLDICDSVEFQIEHVVIKGKNEVQVQGEVE